MSSIHKVCGKVSGLWYLVSGRRKDLKLDTRYQIPDTRRNQAGFTLLEVMIALSILAGMSLMIFASSSQFLNSKTNTEARDDAHHSVYLALNRMCRDLEMAFIVSSKDLLGQTFDGDLGFMGKEDRVDFVNFSHTRYVQQAKESEVAEISYYMEAMPDEPDKKILMRRESTVVDKNLQEGGRSFAMLEGISDVQFEYFDSKGGESQKGEWKKTWDTKSTDAAGRLPRAVRITVELPMPGQEQKAKFTGIALIEMNKGPLAF